MRLLALCPLVVLYHSLKHWDKCAGHAPSGVADSAFSVTEQRLTHQSRQMPALPISLELFSRMNYFSVQIVGPEFTLRPDFKGHQEKQSGNNRLVCFLYCQYSGKPFAWELNFEISHVSLY